MASNLMNYEDLFLLDSDEDIENHFILVNVLNRFHLRTTQMQIGYMSYDEAKSLLDNCDEEFKKMDHDSKINILVDQLIRDRETKVNLLNELLNHSEIFLSNIDTPNLYGFHVNSLDKSKREYENILLNRLSKLNGDLSRFVLELQSTKLNKIISESLNKSGNEKNAYEVDGHLISLGSLFRFWATRCRELSSYQYQVSKIFEFFLMIKCSSFFIFLNKKKATGKYNSHGIEETFQ